MVIVKGSFPIKERKRDEALSLMETFAETSRAEAGCLAYEVYCRADEPSTIMVWQQWRSPATLESHFSSDSMEEFLDHLALLLDGRADTDYFDVQTQLDDGVAADRSIDLIGSRELIIAKDVTIH